MVTCLEVHITMKTYLKPLNLKWKGPKAQTLYCKYSVKPMKPKKMLFSGKFKVQQKTEGVPRVSKIPAQIIQFS